MVRRKLVLAHLAAAAVLVGCTGLPDRQQEADRIEAELRATPGVEKVYTVYDNSYEAGSSYDLEITMSAAPENQIADVSQKLAQLKANDFAGYRQTTTFVVAPNMKVRENDTPDPAQLADRARTLRGIRTAVADSAAEWSADRLELHTADDTAMLNAVRAQLGAKPLRVSVGPPSGGTATPPTSMPYWDVDFPFDAAAEQRIRGQLASLPVRPRFVSVAGNQLSALDVGIANPETAYADLSAAITALRPSPPHPLYVSWHLNDQSANSAALKFAGSVDAAGCHYRTDTAGEQDPQAYYTPEALAIQKRLRAQFDTC